MSEGAKQPDLEPAPGFAHNVPPAPYEAMFASQQPHGTSLAVNSRAWLGVTSLSVGVMGAFIVVITSMLVGEWAIFVAPTLLLPISVVAIVFGHLGLSNARKSNSAMGVSIAGMIVGYVLVSFFIVMLVIIGFFALVIANWSTGV